MTYSYKSVKEMDENSLIINMDGRNRNADKATKWLREGRKIFCVGRNSNGVVIHFEALKKEVNK